MIIIPFTTSRVWVNMSGRWIIMYKSTVTRDGILTENVQYMFTDPERLIR